MTATFWMIAKTVFFLIQLLALFKFNVPVDKGAISGMMHCEKIGQS